MGKIIGVFPLFDEKKNSIWMLPGYMDGIRQAGGIPIILPQRASATEMAQLAQVCDGYLFTGGHDVNPEMYGESKRKCGVINQERDEIEQQFFRYAYTEDKPILGICRGIQIINVLLGGSLYQDIPTEYETAIQHVMKPPYDGVQHEVSIEIHSPLYDLIQKNHLGVNSYHHQAIKEIASDLDVMATASDGLVEAVFSKKKHFVWGVQWHPEFSFRSDEVSRKIFRAFVSACKN